MNIFEKIFSEPKDEAKKRVELGSIMDKIRDRDAEEEKKQAEVDTAKVLEQQEKIDSVAKEMEEIHALVSEIAALKGIDRIRSLHVNLDYIDRDGESNKDAELEIHQYDDGTTRRSVGRDKEVRITIRKKGTNIKLLDLSIKRDSDEGHEWTAAVCDYKYPEENGKMSETYSWREAKKNKTGDFDAEEVLESVPEVHSLYTALNNLKQELIR